MAQVNTIKDLYENEELSLREIARRTKLSFQTVQKYAYMEDWSEEKLPDLQAEHSFHRRVDGGGSKGAAKAAARGCIRRKTRSAC